MKKVGILGGTFDPPHIGHLLIAEEVYQTLQLEEVWFIPSYEPPHKDNAKSKPAYRQDMVEAAISNNDHFALQSIEIDRLGKSYTIDTIKLLQDQYPEVTFYFIIGADMVEYLPKWYKIEELIKIVQFVGVKRTDYQINSNYPIKEVNIPTIEISSTMIRERVLKEQSIKYLVPEKVSELIKEHQLYGKK